MKHTRLPNLLALLFVALGLSGCANHYEIRDPQSGSVYHTKDYDRSRSGSITFTDEKSQTEVTIQNSEIQEVSKERYEEETEGSAE